MTQHRRTAAVLLVVTVLLAGCGAGIGGDRPDSSATAPDPSETESGTLAFYVSDQPAAIDSFASLTVTVTEIGVHRSGGDEAGDPTDETTITANATTTDGANESASESPNGTDVPTGETEPTAGNGSGGWTTYAVDDATVDLTELRGANASKIADLRLPAGEYNVVTMTVSNVSGTLTTGETTSVKLPSETLRLNKGFVLEANGSALFVFDVAVHEAGGSGKYVLRPTIGESGSDVEIRDVATNRTDRAGTAPNGSANAASNR